MSHNSQGWATLKPGVQKPIYIGGRDLTTEPSAAASEGMHSQEAILEAELGLKPRLYSMESQLLCQRPESGAVSIKLYYSSN